MVFSGAEEACRDNGHGDVTVGDPSLIGANTDVEDVRGNTGATQGKYETES